MNYESRIYRVFGVRNRHFACILIALSFLQTALAGYYGGDYRNDSDSMVWLRIRGTNTIRSDWTTIGSVTAHTTAGLGDWTGSGGEGGYIGEFKTYGDSGYATLLDSGAAPLHIYEAPGYPVVYTYGAPATTYYWCVYHVNWTNTGPRFAALQYWVVDNAGQVWEPTNMQSRVVAPGNYVDFYVTNSIGTNNVGCGKLAVGDGRDENNPLTYFDGTKYSQLSSGPGSGIGDDRVGSGTDPNPLNPYSTNGATTADIRRLADMIGYLDADLRFADAAARSNAFRQLLSSELFRTNTWGQLNGILTNVAGLGTNFGGMGSNLASLASRFGTNLDWAATNQIDAASGMLASVSNLVSTSSFASDTASMQSYGSGLGNASDELGAAWNNLVDPGVAFGRLRVTINGKNFDWEANKAVGFDVGEKFNRSDFKTWLRLLVLWGTLVSALVWFGSELREGVRNIVTLPSAWAGDAMPLGVLSAVPGTNLSIKWLGVLALVVIVAFLPSLLVAGMATTWAAVGATLSDLATWSTNVITLVPSEVWSVAWAVEQWFPLFEVLLIGINCAIVGLAEDYLVAFLMFLSRLFQSAMPA